MADFVQMLKDWKRMCNAMTAMNGCEDCPIVRNIHNARCGDMPGEMQDVESIAREVEKWAAENPVVYPTWIDVMKMYGVTDETGYCYLDSAYKPIPADIAEKLGIEPKEDV